MKVLLRNAVFVLILSTSFKSIAANNNSGALTFTNAITILNVESVEESIKYYTKSLGFKADWIYPTDVKDKNYAQVSNGMAVIRLSEKAQGSKPTWVFYSVKDVDGLYAKYKALGAKIKKAPTNEPRAFREMLVEDLDGHVLKIGSPIK